MNKANIKVGDLVEEQGTDSGVWLVTELYRNTPRNMIAAKLVLPGKPNCVTHVPVEKLRRVGPGR
jgi:hypothetical protein